MYNEFLRTGIQVLISAMYSRSLLTALQNVWEKLAGIFGLCFSLLTRPLFLLSPKYFKLRRTCSLKTAYYCSHIFDDT